MYFIKSVDDLEEKLKQELLRFYGIDIFVVNSRFIQKRLINNFGIKSILSYPLVDFRQYKISKNTKKYIALINYRKEKGKEIFRQIAKTLPNRKFLTVRGWCPIIRQVSLNEKNILIVGPIKDMRKIYSQTKILLIPSICEEIYSRVIKEAQINGIPTICSNIGGMKEAIGEGGVLIDAYLMLIEISLLGLKKSENLTMTVIIKI